MQEVDLRKSVESGVPRSPFVDNFRLADKPGVIAWRLEPEGRASREILQTMRYTTTIDKLIFTMHA